MKKNSLHNNIKKIVNKKNQIINISKNNQEKKIINYKNNYKKFKKKKKIKKKMKLNK